MHVCKVWQTAPIKKSTNINRDVEGTSTALAVFLEVETALVRDMNVMKYQAATRRDCAICLLGSGMIAKMNWPLAADVLGAMRCIAEWLCFVSTSGI